VGKAAKTPLTILMQPVFVTTRSAQHMAALPNSRKTFLKRSDKVGWVLQLNCHK
jgi:hypothetical protein